MVHEDILVVEHVLHRIVRNRFEERKAMVALRLPHREQE